MGNVNEPTNTHTRSNHSDGFASTPHEPPAMSDAGADNELRVTDQGDIKSYSADSSLELPGGVPDCFDIVVCESTVEIEVAYDAIDTGPNYQEARPTEPIQSEIGESTKMRDSPAITREENENPVDVSSTLLTDAHADLTEVNTEFNKTPAREEKPRTYLTIATYADATNLAIQYPELAIELLALPLSNESFVLEDLLITAVPPSPRVPLSTTPQDLTPRVHSAEAPNWALAPGEPVISLHTAVEDASAAARQFSPQRSKHSKQKNHKARMELRGLVTEETRALTLEEERARAGGPSTMVDDEDSRRYLGGWNVGPSATEDTAPSEFRARHRDPPPHQFIPPSCGTSDRLAWKDIRKSECPVIVINRDADSCAPASHEANANHDSSSETSEWDTIHDPWMADAAMIDAQQPRSCSRSTRRGGSLKEKDDTEKQVDTQYSWVSVSTASVTKSKTESQAGHEVTKVMGHGSASRSRFLSSSSVASWENVNVDEWQSSYDPWSVSPPKPKGGHDPNYLQVSKAKFKSRTTNFDDWPVPWNLSTNSYDAEEDSLPSATSTSLSWGSRSGLDDPCANTHCSEKPLSQTWKCPTHSGPMVVQRSQPEPHQPARKKYRQSLATFTRNQFSFDELERSSALVCATVPSSPASVKDELHTNGSETSRVGAVFSAIDHGNKIFSVSNSLPTSPTSPRRIEPQFEADKSEYCNQFDRPESANSSYHPHLRQFATTDLTHHPRPSAAIPIKSPSEVNGSRTPDYNRNRYTPLSFFSKSDENIERNESRSRLPDGFSQDRTNWYITKTPQIAPTPSPKVADTTGLRASSPSFIPERKYFPVQQRTPGYEFGTYLHPVSPLQEPQAASDEFNHNASMSEISRAVYNPAYVSPNGRSSRAAEVPEDWMSGSRRYTSY